MLDLDTIWIDFECPACTYQDMVLMREVRLESLVWCHNCKQQIQLHDAEASVDDAKKQMDDAMKKLNNLFKNL